MLRNLQTIPKSYLAIIYSCVLIAEFILAAISFISIPWLGIILIIAGNITLIYGAYLLLKKRS